MELIFFFINVLCFTFFALQTPCTSLQIQLQSSKEKQEGAQLFQYPTLPRKLRFTEEEAFKGNEAQPSISNSKQKGHVSGKAYQKEQATIMHGGSSRGTRQQWMEAGGPDISQYFTLDYSHVRRRRPVHNKSLPFGP